MYGTVYPGLYFNIWNRKPNLNLGQGNLIILTTYRKQNFFVSSFMLYVLSIGWTCQAAEILGLILFLSFTEICASDVEIKLKLGDSFNISSNKYPGQYPTLHRFTQCYRQIEANEGAFQIKILDSRINVHDTIAIGLGLNPSFPAAVYAINAAAKSPSSDNHPRSIYVPSTIIGSHMWIIFGIGHTYSRPSFHQFDSITMGFLVEISVLAEPGNFR